MNLQRPFALAAMAAVLTGCAAQPQTLTSTSTDAVADASFRHQGPAMTVRYAGKVYQAAGFPVIKHQDLDALRQRYGSGSYYNGIVSGLNRDHVAYAARADLRAADGEALRCDLAWQGTRAPAATCKASDDTILNLAFR